MTRGLALPWFIGMALALGGCGSDSSSSSTPKVPTVSLDSLTPSEGSGFTWDADHDDAIPELTLPCDGALVVGVSASNWTSRAPGGCGQTQLCGHAEVVVTAANGATSSAEAVSSPLLRLPVASLAEWVGSASVVARLVRDDGSPYPDPMGAEITSTRSVVFVAPASCDEPTSTGGTTSTGGMTSTGGAGAGGASN